MSLIQQIKLPRKAIVFIIAALAILSFVLMAPANAQITYESIEKQKSAHVPDTKLGLTIQVQETVNNVQNQYL